MMTTGKIWQTFSMNEVGLQACEVFDLFSVEGEVHKKEEEKKMKLIVTRHKSAVEFIHREIPGFREARVVAEATAEDVRGRTVAGNIPLHLAALCKEVWAVEFTGTPPRGTELTLADMDAAGAVMRCYTVRPGTARENNTSAACHERKSWGCK